MQDWDGNLDECSGISEVNDVLPVKPTLNLCHDLSNVFIIDIPKGLNDPFVDVFFEPRFARSKKIFEVQFVFLSERCGTREHCEAQQPSSA